MINPLENPFRRPAQDDNPYRQPAPGASLPAASSATKSTPTSLPVVSADAISGTGLPSSCSRLAEANATAVSTVNMGADILSSLETQRAQLISTGTMLSQQREDLARAGALVNKMIRRAFTNKMILRGIALMLLALIVILLIAKYAPRPHPNQQKG